jgi:energy-coupling factor transporter ATP-binding protein EcfA2
MVNYLAQISSMIVHACGVDYEGKGILFVGESGAGKSTLSNLWHQQNGAAIFSDDRIIVREKEGEYRMYGTPWHGEASFVSPHSVKLEHIFFLQHDHRNAVRPLNRADTVVEFLKASFPPFWDSDGVAFAMAFLSDLTEEVPCQALSFKPDASIVDFVKSSV